MDLGAVADTGFPRTSDEVADGRDVCSRPIDLVHLARYTLGNKALEREILDLFVGQSRVTLANLQAADNAKAWREQTHTLLGSARAVGAKRLADRVFLAQKLTWPVEPARRAAIMTAIAAEIEAANDYIRDLFPED